MKIAIIRLSALGDIIQSAVVLQFIKKFKKDIEIHWFVDEK
ncbi:lipopolysaccharide heptosyltransferase I, partial [Campylobacter coli]|nr:lipopolysaccharide heptosyltransferase I [Campylobacter coli]HED6031281.1 lipopolysaccharide heptosyltransferase I [Campylobacter coli]